MLFVSNNNGFRTLLLSSFSFLRWLFYMWLVLALLILTPSASGSDQSPSVLPLKVGYFQYDVPWMFTNDAGSADGIALDFWRLWSEKMDIPVRFIPVTENTAVEQLEQSGVDVIALLQGDSLNQSLSLNRVKLATIQSTLFIDKSTGIDRYDEAMKTLKIGYVQGNNYKAEIHRHFPDARLIPYDTYSAMAEAAANQSANAFLGGELTFRYYLNNRGINNEFTSVDTPLHPVLKQG